MFRSSTILRELVQILAKVTLLLKHSVKLRRCILCGVKRRVCYFRAHTPFHSTYAISQHIRHFTAHMPFRDMLPHLHTIYNDVILLNVLTEV